MYKITWNAKIYKLVSELDGNDNRNKCVLMDVRFEGPDINIRGNQNSSGLQCEVAH